MTTGKALNGKPYAGNPHVRFDEGEVASAAMPRRGFLLDKKLIMMIGAAVVAASASADRTIRENCTLTADTDWTGDGKITLSDNVEINLAGHTLMVHSMDGTGQIISVVNEFSDLTFAGGTISSSGGLSADFPAENLFDNDLSTFACRGTTSSKPIDVCYDFGSAIRINCYRIYAYTSVGSPGFPKNWTFEGSNDGTTWMELDRRSGESMTKSNWYTYDFDNAAAYRHYRLHVTDGSRGTARLDIGELEFGVVDHGKLRMNLSGIANSNLSNILISGTVDVETSGDALVLENDVDMRGFPVSATVDLHGHTLIVSGLSGGGTITSTAEISNPANVTSSRQLTGDLGYLFDGDTSTIVYSGATSADPVILTFGFEVATRIDYYGIYANAPVNSSGFPREWTFEGSNDNSTWTTLDSRSDVVMSKNNWYEYGFTNGSEYRYYRLNVTKGSRWNQDTGKNPRIDIGGEMKLGRRLSGKLVVNVPAGRTVENTDVTLSGNLHLVKDGEGTLVVSKSRQTYTDGTEVADGVLRCGAAVAGLFGADNTEILIVANGTFDIAGKRASGVNTLGKYAFTLNGGTLANSGANVLDSNDYESAMRISLLSDSALDITAFGFLGTETSGLDAGIDLGGNTLSCTMANGMALRLYNMTLKNGRFNVGDTTTGRIFIGYNGGVVATNVDFRLNGQIVVRTDSVFKVRGYEPLGETNNGSLQYGAMEVYGVFKPTSDYFYGCTLMDGATLDLTTRSVPLNALSASTGGCTNLSFAANATISVNLGRRRISGAVPIVSWTAETRPANIDTVRFVRADEGQRYSLAVKQDGLYAYTGLMISIR